MSDISNPIFSWLMTTEIIPLQASDHNNVMSSMAMIIYKEYFLTESLFQLQQQWLALIRLHHSTEYEPSLYTVSGIWGYTGCTTLWKVNLLNKPQLMHT